MRSPRRYIIWRVRTVIRDLLGLKLGVFIILLIVTTLAFRSGSISEISKSVGDRWQEETLIAEFEFPLYKSEDSLTAERQRIRESTEPIFYPFNEARQQTRNVADSIAASLDAVFNAFTNYLIGARRDSIAAGTDLAPEQLSTATVQDSLLYMDLRLQAPIRLSGSIWRHLGWDYARRSPDMPTSTRLAPTQSPLFEQILDAIADRSQRLQLQGVLDVPMDSVLTEYLTVRDTLAQTFEQRTVTSVVGHHEARERIRVWLEETVLRGDSHLSPTAIFQFIEAIFVPSLIYQSGPTELRRREAEALILPVRGMVAEGEEIVRNGERITPEIKQKLDSLERERGSELSATQGRLQLLGQLLLGLTIVGIFGIFLRNARPEIFSSNKFILILALFYAVVVVSFGIVIRFAPTQFIYAVPVVIVSVLLTVIFDSRMAFFGTFVLALLGGLMLDSNFTYTWATLVGGFAAIFSARGLRNRGQLFLTAAYAFGGYALALLAIWLYEGSAWPQLQERLMFAGVGSFLLVTAYPFLWAVERVFDVTTDMRLLELSDTNQPLLRELIKNAPGTFNHSMQVSSLAESVADEVGADVLLTRVGGLYHDIGKLFGPQYFIENLAGDKNPHDNLDPESSARIIIGHVASGLKLGDQYHLPAKVMSFISSHHGTTRTEYFYRQAVELAQTSDSTLDESVFRYPGPRPTSKETGILMLTDTVEAASRTMKDMTGEKLEKLVDHLISQRVASGQLDDTGLTLRDISLIKEVLLKQLIGIHHTRISYPDAPDTAKKD